MSKLFNNNSRKQSELIEKIPTGKILDIAKSVGKYIKGSAEVCADKVKLGNSYVDAVIKSEKYLNNNKYNTKLYYDEKNNKYVFSLYSKDDNTVTKFMFPKRLIAQAIIQELIIKKQLG